MMINAIQGCSRRLGKAQGYHGLPVRDVVFEDGTPAMQSSWQPTPSEVAAIRAGAPLILTVLGSSHPPVLIEVGQVPDAGGTDADGGAV